MKSVKPNWDLNGSGAMAWSMGPIEAVQNGQFAHGPVAALEELAVLANEGDVLVGQMAESGETAAMYMCFDNQFIRLPYGLSGKLAEVLMANAGDGHEIREGAVRLAAQVSGLQTGAEREGSGETVDMDFLEGEHQALSSLIGQARSIMKIETEIEATPSMAP
jgi:hypothetical protein